MRLDGIHHVTCITADARQNLDFYTRVLGLRLVAKSVNQDDPTAYHLFYSDEQGHPGADITFFEYPDSRPGRAGAGMVHRVIWRVGSPGALDFWEKRLAAESVRAEREERGLRFADPEGLDHELTLSQSHDPPLIADHPEVPREVALQGFEGVRAYSLAPERSRPLLEQVMGATSIGNAGWEIRGPERGGTIFYDAPPPGRGIPGAGTVHHIAWQTSVADHGRWLERLEQEGIHSSGIVDRHYFHSIYFREPSGVLFELADDGPGFTVDLSVEELGTRITLPPAFEPRRREIEARLTPLPDPRASWAR